MDASVRGGMSENEIMEVPIKYQKARIVHIPPRRRQTSQIVSDNSETVKGLAANHPYAGMGMMEKMEKLKSKRNPTPASSPATNDPSAGMGMMERMETMKAEKAVEDAEKAQGQTSANLSGPYAGMGLIERMEALKAKAVEDVPDGIAARGVGDEGKHPPKPPEFKAYRYDGPITKYTALHSNVPTEEERAWARASRLRGERYRAQVDADDKVTKAIAMEDAGTDKQSRSPDKTGVKSFAKAVSDGIKGMFSVKTPAPERHGNLHNAGCSSLSKKPDTKPTTRARLENYE